MMDEDRFNVVIRLNVARPDRVYMVERLRRLLHAWDTYMGWTWVVSVDVLWGECPIDPERLPAAMATLPPDAGPENA
jgi:hypothetical protein